MLPLLLLLVPLAAAQPGAFTPEAALALQVLRFESRGLSPAGGMIAYAVTEGYRERSGTLLDRVNFGNGSHVWVQPLDGAPQAITHGGDFSWSPAWSPDGNRLAFYLWRKRTFALAVWDRSSRRTRVYAVRGLSGRHPIAWHPSGQAVLVTTPRVEKRSQAYDSDALVNVIRGDQDPQPYDAANIEVRKYGLLIVDLASGATRLLTPPDFPNLLYSISPDGQRVALEGSVKNSIWVAGVSPVHEIAVLPWAGGPARILLKDTTTRNFAWLPDSSALTWTDGGALWRGPVSGEAARRITLAGARLSGTPLWNAAGTAAVVQAGDDLALVEAGSGQARVLTSGVQGRKSDPVWAPNGETMWFRTLVPETGAQGIGSVDLSGAPPRQLFREDSAIEQLAVDRAGRVVFTRQTMAIPPNVWTLEPRRQLTAANPQVAGLQLGQARLIRWRSRDGEELKGILLLPAGYQEGQKYPVVVWAYETFSSRLHAFELHLYNLQILASRGYAVLMPDVIFRTGATADSYVNCVLPALDHLEKTGVANGRFGLMGHSFGGFATNILTTRTNRFQASIAIAGISDWISFSGIPGDFMRLSHEQGQGRLGGPLSEFRDRYVANSPVFHLADVTTPIMVIHGMDDLGVPFNQAEAMYYGLRRLGKTATLVAYPKEDHLYWNTKREVLLDMWRRIFEWFDRYLK